MDRRAKAKQNRDKAERLNEAWGVWRSPSSLQPRWALVCRARTLPGCFVRRHGYVLFATEAEYRTSPHLSIGKQISVPRPGISAMPGYVRVADAEASRASTLTFTPSPPPKGVVVWCCTFSANGIRRSCEKRRTKRHRSTARCAGFLSVALRQRRERLLRGSPLAALVRC